MKAICHACGIPYEVNPDFIGCLVKCPRCGNEAELAAKDILKVKSRPAAKPVAKAEPFDVLGFILGFVINIPGVFIAALVNGRRGAISALWGILASVVVGCMVGVLIALATP